MNSYIELVKAVKEKDSDWSFTGPQPEQKVFEAEQKCGIRFPNSYRQYLSEVGELEFPNHYLSGIGEKFLDPEDGIMANTTLLIKQYDLPEKLFCLEYDHDAHELACLDLNAMENNECPVVWFNIYERRVIGECAPNFDKFIRSYLEAWL